MRRQAQSGFTLMELVISLLIIGVFMIGVFSILDAKQEIKARQVTKDRMEKIVSRLSAFVETRNRLPCPADPSRTDRQFGWEWDFDSEATNGMPDNYICSNTSNSQTADGNPFNDNNTTGVVPFLSLGLSADDVRDGWGNYFTYAISPVFAFNDFVGPDPMGGYGFNYALGSAITDDSGATITPATVPLIVEARCRSYGWVRMLNDNNKALTAPPLAAGNPLAGNEGVLTNYDWRVAGAGVDPRANSANFKYNQIRRNVALMKAKYCCAIIPSGALPSESVGYQGALAANGQPLKNYFGQSTGGAADYAPPGTDLVIEPINEPGVNAYGLTRPTVAQANVGVTPDAYREAGDPNAAGFTVGRSGYSKWSSWVSTNLVPVPWPSIVVPAFVLISHGPNKTGAYAVNGTFTRIGVPIGNSEQENADLDRVFVEGSERFNTGANTDFDDVVIWMTQDMIMAYNGTATCAEP